jgi:hypothetical protein
VAMSATAAARSRIGFRPMISGEILFGGSTMAPCSRHHFTSSVSSKNVPHYWRILPSPSSVDVPPIRDQDLERFANWRRSGGRKQLAISLSGIRALLNQERDHFRGAIHCRAAQTRLQESLCHIFAPKRGTCSHAEAYSHSRQIILLAMVHYYLDEIISGERRS